MSVSDLHGANNNGPDPHQMQTNYKISSKFKDANEVRKLETKFPNYVKEANEVRKLE